MSCGVVLREAKSWNSVSRSCRWLQIPIRIIVRYLRAGKYEELFVSCALVYLFIDFECLADEVLELAGNEARDKKRNRIAPRHKQLAVRNDEELSKLLGNVMQMVGVLTNINQYLLPKTAARKEKEIGSASQ
ncbi:histone H2AX-like [Olea europaea var. sylvestris]|uniref:histone H2AX-like n=1 Tax=Olea europaea var. sylvestris TaxID=158386 RepID=UPI000C1CCE4C|nr:histone H2AX-like [Olea europaea var. sylvestris]